jgi:hypothetical protein
LEKKINLAFLIFPLDQELEIKNDFLAYPKKCCRRGAITWSNMFMRAKKILLLRIKLNWQNSKQISLVQNRYTFQDMSKILINKTHFVSLSFQSHQGTCCLLELFESKTLFIFNLS